MSSGYIIPLPEEMADRLSDRPIFRQRVVFEEAINRALDEQGWPRGDRGAIPIPVSYWYVNLFRRGRSTGYVGPISDEEQAARAASSWRGGGLCAIVSRTPEGPPLTNAHQS